MNILILTPDRVGSTLLQRLITVYANAADKNNLTINLHELTNGIEKYYNDKFGKEVLGKKENRWGYYQTLLTYNNWGENIDPSRSLTYNKDDLKELAAAEHSSWQFGNINSSSLLANNEIPMIDFRRSDLKDV